MLGHSFQRRDARWLAGVGALAAAALLASAGSTTVIPGGGPTKSDCYVVLNVGGTRPLKSAKALECTDGDPGCDTDGLCNNVCALQVQLCINQPGVGNCVAPSGLQKLKFKSHPATFTVNTPSSLLGHQCNDPVAVHLPVKVSKKGKKSAGVLEVTGFAKAVQGTKPLKDSDTYILKCLPRVGPCPTTTTSPPPTTLTTVSTTSTTGPTISTTTTMSTTTSTSLPAIQCCVPPSPYACFVGTASQCGNARGFSVGPGSCVPDPCPPAIQCCVPPSPYACFVGTASQCGNARGFSVGPGSCVPYPCSTITSTTTTLPTGGMVLKGALTSTLARFNYNGSLGLPGALAACHTSFGASTHVCTDAELQSAAAAGDLKGLKDTAGMTVTSFWAIDSSQPPLQQCNDDAPGTGSGRNWEYGTAHTASRGQKVSLDNGSGTLGALQSSQQCAILGTPAWVGCCQ